MDTPELATLASSINDSTSILKNGVDVSINIEDKFSQVLDLFGKDSWFYNSFSALCKSSGIEGSSKEKPSIEVEAENFKNSSEDKGSDISEAFSGVLSVMGVKTKPSKKTKTSGVGISDLKDLDEEHGLGFAVISAQLDQIIKSNKKGKAGQLGDVFADLVVGATGIALLGTSLIVVAGAMNLFGNVEWGPAIGGLVAFSAFVVGAIFLAKAMSKSLEDFFMLSVASVALAAGLGAFSLSLLLASKVFTGEDWGGLGSVNILSSLACIAFFSLFLTAVAEISRILDKEQKNFVEFAKSSLYLSAGLAAFSVALLITSRIFSGEAINILGFSIPPMDVAGAIIGVGSFTIFLVGFSLLAKLFKSQKSLIKDFAMTSILLSGGLLAFSISLLIVSKIFSLQPLNILGFEIPALSVGGAIAGVAAFSAFLFAVILLAKFANSVIGDMLLFAVSAGMMAMSLGMFAFAVSIGALAMSNTEFEIGGMKVKGGGWKGALAFLGVFTAFTAVFAAVGFGLSFVMLVFPVVLAASIMISASISMMALSLSLASGVMSGPVEYVDPETKQKQTLLQVNTAKATSFFKAYADFIIAFKEIPLFAAYKAGKIGKSAAEVSKGVLAIAHSLSIVTAALDGGTVVIDGKSQSFSKFNKDNFKVKDGKIISDSPLGSLFSSFDAIIKTLSGISKKDVKNFKKISESIVAVETIITSMAKSMNIVGEFYKTENEVVNNVGGWTVALEPFTSLINAFVKVASDTSKKSAEAFALLSQGVEPMMNAISTMADLPGKFKDIDEAAFKSTITNIKKILNGDDSDNPGLVSVLRDSFSKLGKLSEKELNSVEAFNSAIGSLKDTFSSLNSIEVPTEFNSESLSGSLTNGIDLLKTIKERKGDINGASNTIETLLNSLGSMSEVSSKLNEIVSFDVEKSRGFLQFINTFGRLPEIAVTRFSKIFESFAGISSFSIELPEVGKIKTLSEEIDKIKNPFASMNDSIINMKNSLEQFNDVLRQTMSLSKGETSAQAAQSQAALGNKILSNPHSTDEDGEKKTVTDVYNLLRKIMTDSNDVKVHITNKNVSSIKTAGAHMNLKEWKTEYEI